MVINTENMPLLAYEGALTFINVGVPPKMKKYSVAFLTCTYLKVVQTLIDII
jgi:hypothetical protein